MQASDHGIRSVGVMSNDYTDRRPAPMSVGTNLLPVLVRALLIINNRRVKMRMSKLMPMLQGQKNKNEIIVVIHV